MIKVLLNQMTILRSVTKVFMKKRDVKIYDHSWKNISELRTEYDIDIIALLIEPKEWEKIVAIEKEFTQKYPKYKFNYNLIESDSNANNYQISQNGKLIYDSETAFNIY